MIAYSQLLKYIKSLAQSEEYINTSTMGEEIDLNKSNIFPLFNVDVTGASFTSNRTVTFDVTMSALDVRSINKESEYVEVQGDKGSIVNVEIVDAGQLQSGFPDTIIQLTQSSTSGDGTGALVRMRIQGGEVFSFVEFSPGGAGANFSIGDTINVSTGVSTEDTVIRVTEIDAPTIQKEVNADKFYGNDNEIDNHNATISVLNNIWVKMHRDFAENNITASDNPRLEMITFSDKNLLDGWSINFTVEMPTSGVDLCIEC
jgi:hypothetical protein